MLTKSSECTMLSKSKGTEKRLVPTKYGSILFSQNYILRLQRGFRSDNSFLLEDNKLKVDKYTHKFSASSVANSLFRRQMHLQLQF